MTWADDHSRSERLASAADLALRSGKADESERLYREAAAAEVEALSALTPDKHRTIGITAVSAVNDRHVTINALEMALQRRCPEIGLLHHSEQGCTYASEDYQILLAEHGIVCSMSRRGNCHDNAVMESFFSTVKTELADRFDSCSEAKRKLFAYIEVFYNQRRRHSTIGQISPATYERRAHEEGMDAMENRQERGFPPRPHPSVFSGKEDRRPTQTA